jgi:hypothetical protein
MRPDLNELKQRIIHSLDVIEFLDILGLELADLMDPLEELIEDNYARLDRACR